MNHPLLIHKKILEWRWYKDCAVSKLFLHVLLTAKVEKVFENSRYVQRGEIYTTLRSLEKETGLSVNQIRSSLKKLCSTGEIEFQSSKRFSKIKVLNFDHYQQAKPNSKISVIYQGTNETFLKECVEDQIYIETIAMKKNITTQVAKDLLSKFKTHIDISGDKKSSKRQFTSHFGNWLNHQNLKTAQRNVEKSHIYKWRGVPEQKGTKDEYERDRKNYDHPGFDFKLIKTL